MDALSLLLLLSSILLSSGRNLLSKNISDAPFGTRGFFLCQSLIFGSGSITLLPLAMSSLLSPSVTTLLLAFIYSVLLIVAQWFYTLALSRGKVGISATVYSLGFVLPTLSGVLFFDESLGVVNALGIAAVLPTVIISGLKPRKMVENKDNGTYIAPLIAAMLASGGLGIVQKVQQSSAAAAERDVFLFLAFSISALISLAAYLAAKKSDTALIPRKGLFAALIGICFALCNILNTTLAGRLPSAVFFPLLNVGSILFSLALGIVLYREKVTRRDAVILALGALAIVLINL